MHIDLLYHKRVVLVLVAAVDIAVECGDRRDCNGGRVVVNGDSGDVRSPHDGRSFATGEYQTDH